MARSFVLDLNLADWNTLNKKAVEKGFSDHRDLINHKMADLAEKISNLKQCSHNNKRKRRNSYAIPNDYQELFMQLACLHSSSVSAVIFRYIIVDELIEEDKSQEDQLGIGS